ncbi:acyloxyacyl hydrolase [Baaleninema sp.]|uniref:acyloxyacyl hydrolase n=1 Tax=Baaleninema sp. TaxID=3101197 RepID=UPI003D079145
MRSIFPSATLLLSASAIVCQFPPNAAATSSVNSSSKSSFLKQELDEFEETESPLSAPVNFGERGSERWYFHGGGATTLDDDRARRLGILGGGLSHFFLNGHSINAELNGLAFDQTGDDAVGVNLNLLLRWHLVRQDNWSLYVDGGAGILGTTNDVPAAGTSFNFTPQAGGGATIALTDEKRLMLGLRWHHISNADLYEDNPGRDSLMLYFGLNFPLK